MSTPAPAEKSAKKSAKKPAKKSPASGPALSPAERTGDLFAPTPRPSPRVQREAAGLTNFGQVVEVAFGRLFSNDNVRRIRLSEEQGELNTSVKETKAQERIVGYLRDPNNPQGPIDIESGGSRHLALAKAGYPAEAMIEIVLKETPATRAESRVRGLRANIHHRMLWPDTAVAVGEAAGVLTREGKVRSKEEIEAAVRSGEALSPDQLSKELPFEPGTIRDYMRVSHVPYDLLRELWEAGGTIKHGAELARYYLTTPPWPAEKIRAALNHFKKNRAWPDVEPPPRLRAEGAGRPAKSTSPTPPTPPTPPPTPAPTIRQDALPRDAGAAGDKRRPKPEVPAGQGEWNWPAPAPTPAPASLVDGGPASMLEESTRSQEAASASAPDAPLVGVLDEVCDEFGLSREAGELFTVIAACWQVEPIEAWPAERVDRLKNALEVFAAGGGSL